MNFVVILAVLQFCLVDGRLFTNVALHKTVEMSSTYKDTFFGSYAVDGQNTGRGFAAITNEQIKPWLLVDLQEDVLISSFFIQNLADEVWSQYVPENSGTPWFTNSVRLVIEIGHQTYNNTVVWHDNNTFGSNKTIELDFPRCGRLVRLWLDAVDWLAINELEVYGLAYEVTSQWSQWGKCSRSCGNGTTTHSRLCSDSECCGFVEETSECNTNACPVTEFCVDSNGLTNVGLGKQVELSSVKGNATSGHFAVDGVKTGIPRDGIAATQYDTNPWMTIDLENEFLISSVFIQNLDSDDWLIKLTWKQNPSALSWHYKPRRLLVGIGRTSDNYTVVWDRDEVIGLNRTLDLAHTYCGRFVRIALQAYDSLSVSELEVCGKEDEGWTNWSVWSNFFGTGAATRNRTCTGVTCCGYGVETVSYNSETCLMESDDDSCNAKREPRDCQDVVDSAEGKERQSGVYRVTPVGLHTGFDVYCEIDGLEAWLVIQRRLSDSENFNRTWVEYAAGFGIPTDNSWLGLRHLYQILSQGYYKLHIALEDMQGNTTYADYDTFKLGDPSTQYKLFVDEYSGDAGDALQNYNGQPFVTWDRGVTGNISTRECGWWATDSESFYTNLNGLYLGQTFDPNLIDAGMVWNTRSGSDSQLKRTEMKIKRGD